LIGVLAVWLALIVDWELARRARTLELLESVSWL